MSLSKIVPDLPDELWKIVLRNPESAAVGIVTNKLLNELSKPTLKEVYDGIVKPLMAQQTTIQSKLCDTFLVSADIVRGFPFSTRRRYGGGEYHVFNTMDVVPKLLQQTGGIVGYVRRVSAKNNRLARKRSAVNDLEERKKHASAKRMKSLDGEIRAAGLGQSLHDWANAISERIGRQFDPFLAKFGQGDVLMIYKSSRNLKSPVSLKDAVNAVKSLDAHYSPDAIEARRVAAAAAISARAVDRVAGVTIACDRQCTHTCSDDGTRCRNTHRRDSPVIGRNGPVCGACARLI